MTKLFSLSVLLFSFSHLVLAGGVSDISATAYYTGTIQPESRTLELGARNWNIELKEISLEGETTAEITKSWKKFLAIQGREFVTLLTDKSYFDPEGEEFEITKPYIYPELVEFVNTTDTVLEYSYGKGKSKEGKAISEWFKTEILTRTGRQSLAEYSDKDLKFFKDLEWTHFHVHDQAAELLGCDVIIIREGARIFKITISFDAI